MGWTLCRRCRYGITAFSEREVLTLTLNVDTNVPNYIPDVRRDSRWKNLPLNIRRWNRVRVIDMSSLFSVVQERTSILPRQVNHTHTFVLLSVDFHRQNPPQLHILTLTMTTKHNPEPNFDLNPSLNWTLEPSQNPPTHFYSCKDQPKYSQDPKAFSLYTLRLFSSCSYSVVVERVHNSYSGPGMRLFSWRSLAALSRITANVSKVTQWSPNPSSETHSTCLFCCVC